MKSVKRIALTAALAFATTFTFFCSTKEDSKEEGETIICTNDLLGCPYGSTQLSSTIVLGSSSSVTTSSSSWFASSSSLIVLGNDGLMQNALYQPGPLPTGTTGTFSVETNGAIISGGSSIITVTSNRALTRIYVQFIGGSGYYALDILENYLISVERGIYVYEVPLQLSQSLLSTLQPPVAGETTSGQTQMTFSGSEGSGAAATYSPPASASVEAIRVNSGVMQINLSWNSKVDLDLHVTPPNGPTIYYGNRRSGNGTMDLDANPVCSNDIRNENIFFSTPLVDGDYLVEVNMYKNCVSSATTYKVQAYVNGQPHIFSAGQDGRFLANEKTRKTIGIIRIQDGLPVPYVSSSSSVFSSSSVYSSSSVIIDEISSSSNNVPTGDCTGANNNPKNSEYYCYNGRWIEYDYVTDRANRSYKTVTIGGQTWMAENLNYDVPDNSTDVCYNWETYQEEYCYDYGRLYNWATANQDNVCPQGWHLPSAQDWAALIAYVDKGLTTAGTKLKSVRGWGWDISSTIVGTDNFGFSALPGGSSDFGDALMDGYWWSSTNEGDNTAYSLHMSYSAETATPALSYKYSLYSVRCIKNPN